MLHIIIIIVNPQVQTYQARFQYAIKTMIFIVYFDGGGLCGEDGGLERG